MQVVQFLNPSNQSDFIEGRPVECKDSCYIYFALKWPNQMCHKLKSLSLDNWGEGRIVNVGQDITSTFVNTYKMYFNLLTQVAVATV